MQQPQEAVQDRAALPGGSKPATWLHVLPLCLQFAPSYSDYVLYSDGGPADNVKRKKFRGQKGAGGASAAVAAVFPFPLCTRKHTHTECAHGHD